METFALRAEPGLDRTACPIQRAQLAARTCKAQVGVESVKPRLSLPIRSCQCLAVRISDDYRAKVRFWDEQRQQLVGYKHLRSLR
jgi:hypothetical protein